MRTEEMLHHKVHQRAVLYRVDGRLSALPDGESVPAEVAEPTQVIFVHL